MHTAKFSIHRGLSGFDFAVSPVNRVLCDALADPTLLEKARTGSIETGSVTFFRAVGGLSRPSFACTTSLKR
jgi:hypothetical protein